MAYNSSAYDQLDNSQVDNLRRSGFVLQERKKVFPSSPGVPTHDMTLLELATMDDPAPRPAEPRTKPKVKLTADPKSKAKLEAKPKASSSSRDTERKKEPDASRPPEGAADVPDGPPTEPVPPAPSAPPPGRGDPPHDTKGVEALKAKAKSVHHPMTHVPKNPYCEVCTQESVL